ncbi:hypothetical protein PMI07_006665 [Rhizobium sp. CF080]|nr:hypothetical protein PMI07_006665 [Rhizobium sp. CF080]
MFTQVIQEMKVRQHKPGYCQRIADYQQIIVELNEALAAIRPGHLH